MTILSNQAPARAFAAEPSIPKKGLSFEVHSLSENQIPADLGPYRIYRHRIFFTTQAEGKVIQGWAFWKSLDALGYVYIHHGARLHPAVKDRITRDLRSFLLQNDIPHPHQRRSRKPSPAELLRLLKTKEM